MGAGKWLMVLFMFIAAFAGMTKLSPVYTFLLIPIISFGAMLVGKPRLFIYIYLSVQSIYPLLQSLTVFGPLKYLNEIMAVVLYTIFFGHLLLRRINPSGVEKFYRLCLVFIGYCFLNWLINRGIAKGMMQFFVIYMSFIPLVFLVREYFSEEDFGVLLKWTFGFFWVNFILNLGWWFRINPLPNEHVAIGNMVDHAIGTIGGCNYIAYFCCMMIFLLLALLMNGGLVKPGRIKIIKFTLGAVVVQLYMTYTNHAYAFFILALIPFAYMTRIWKKWYTLAGLVVVIGAFVFTASRNEMASQAMNTTMLQSRYKQLSDSPKMQLYDDLLVTNARENPGEWIFGVGPGSGMGHIGMDNLTPFALRMLLPYYSAADKSKMQMTSITGHTYSAVFSIWGDLGVIGFVLFVSMHILAISYCLKKIRTGGERDVVVGQFLIASFVLWAILGLVIDAMITMIPIWMWIWVGWLMRKNNDETVKTFPVSECNTIVDTQTN